MVLQAETTECGLAALAILLGYQGTHVTLEELRLLAGSTRLGVSALMLMQLAEHYGFVARLFRREMEDMQTVGFPMIAYCRFIHFVVVEDITADEVQVNDPAVGPARIPIEDFADDFTGLVLTLSPGPILTRQGCSFSLRRWFKDRIDTVVPQLVGAAAFSWVVVAAILAFAFFAGRLIDRVSGGSVVWPDLVALCLAAGVAFGAGWMRDRAAVAAAFGLATEASLKGLDRLSRLPERFFSNRLSSQIVAKLSAPGEIVRKGHALAAGLDFSGLVAPCVYAFWIDPWIGSLIVGIAALEVAVVSAVWRRRGGVVAGQAARPLACVGFDPDTLGRMEPHLVSGGESELFSRLAGLHARASNAAIRATVSRLRLDAVRLVVRFARLGATLIAGILALERARLSIGSVGELLVLSLVVGIPLERLARLDGLRDFRGAIHQLADLEDAQPALHSETSSIVRKGVRVSVDHLAWRPSPDQPFVFSKFSLDVPAGGQIGVTGQSLSGKSALSQLICGFLEPTEGDILFDGTSCSAPAQAGALLVAGRGPIIAATVRENLLLGLGLADAQLLEVLAEVGLDVELDARGGLDLYLDQAGLELSGGQQRRLEIARALARSPSVLVIDEALDGVDWQLEMVIRSAIRRRGITLVLISRRAESLAQCEAVVNLDDYVPSAGSLQ
ncbi:MAG: ATP-binding cassette domain-containing protein [Acidipila sp.]|nr:ATP-binding cassette domain-containing protein [Acidipila sp.]